MNPWNCTSYFNYFIFAVKMCLSLILICSSKNTTLSFALAEVFTNLASVCILTLFFWPTESSAKNGTFICTIGRVVGCFLALTLLTYRLIEQVSLTKGPHHLVMNDHSLYEVQTANTSAAVDRQIFSTNCMIMNPLLQRGLFFVGSLK